MINFFAQWGRECLQTPERESARLPLCALAPGPLRARQKQTLEHRAARVHTAQLSSHPPPPAAEHVHEQVAHRRAQNVSAEDQRHLPVWSPQMRLQLLAPSSLVLRRRPSPTPSAPPPPLRRGGAAAPTATSAAPTPAAASTHRGGGCRGLVRRRRRLGVPQRAETPRELLPRGARLCQLCKQRQPVRPAAGTVAGAEGRVHRPLVGVMVGAEGAEHEQRRADVAGGAQRVHHGRVADEGGAHL